MSSLSRYDNSWNNRNHASVVFYDNDPTNIIDVDRVWNRDSALPMIACNLIDDKIINQQLLFQDTPSNQIHNWFEYCAIFQCPGQASLAPDTVTQDYRAKPLLSYRPVRLGLQPDTPKDTKYIFNYTLLPLFDDNIYAIYLRSIHYQETITPCQGFSDSHKNNLMQWIRKKQGKPFIVVFDWDQTISVTNGIIVPQNISPKMYHDCTEYLLGGYTRLKMFQELETFILKNHGKIFVLTSNTLAYDVNKRPFFLKMTQQVFSSMDDLHLLTSYQDGSYCSKSSILVYNDIFFYTLKYILKNK